MMFYQLDYSLTQYRSTGFVRNVLELTELCLQQRFYSFCITDHVPKCHVTICVEAFADNVVDGQFSSQQN